MGVASLGALGEGGTSRPSWGCFLLLLEPAVHFICILLSPFSKFKAESSGFWRELPPGLSPQGHLALSPRVRPSVSGFFGRGWEGPRGLGSARLRLGLEPDSDGRGFAQASSERYSGICAVPSF